MLELDAMAGEMSLIEQDSNPAVGTSVLLSPYSESIECMLMQSQPTREVKTRSPGTLQSQVADRR